MSDNRRRYRTVREQLKKLYPFEPQSNLARHLNTLAGLVSGIVSSNSAQLPKIAKKVPDIAVPKKILGLNRTQTNLDN
jgi:hypothetical protein